MASIETFDSPLLQEVQFNDDGSLKQSGKQNVRFYNKKRLSFRGKLKLNQDGTPVLDVKGKPVPDIDPKTGLPYKEAFEEVVEMVRIETKGDTNIVDDIADDLRKRQFYRQYKYFREGKIPDGNPIEDFDFLQPSTVMELHMMGIHVIQQAAVMSDLECERLRDQPGYEIRDICSQWLRANSPQGQLGKATALELENAKLKRQLAEAQSAGGHAQRIERQMAQEKEMAENPEEPVRTMELTPEQLSRGPGRPRKV